MRTDFYYDSLGVGKIHGCRWTPDGKPVAVVQILHGIAEYVERYDEFARFLNKMGILVVAEDHMGHGKSFQNGGLQGYFEGGWFTAVDDSYQLLRMTKEEFPDIPYVLMGHSMGSFMARTILARYPNSGIAGAIICGTGWQPEGIIKMGLAIAKLVCRSGGDQKPNQMLHGMMFNGYNKRVEHQRTEFDWLNRDDKQVDAYVADPLCGFVACAGLLRDMLTGIAYIQQRENLDCMDKELPVFFIAGGDDPVGGYGKTVRKTAAVFRDVGMNHVSERIYPLCRHEILNEINREEVFTDVAQWLQAVIART